ncbi:tyrosine-type recombinase/integrase [Streptomyces tubercidicus]|uniref:tyrosine-type recombinase/integrase n=1 Tax=Streptomyces TaxID=1883 RepID=UPI001F510126|nr:MULTISPECIES: site-specific integrase [Streptomyces]WSK35040.1 site-specific integrase [Streptomyces tubercidicus]
MEELRDLSALVVPRVGEVVEDPSDLVEPVRLVDGSCVVVEAVRAYLRDLRASGRSAASLRSYALALLRWFRFLWAVEVAWDRAGRAEARDFMVWLSTVEKPVRPRRAGTPRPGSVNAVTRKAYPGTRYAPRTRRHNRAVVNAFYEFHRDWGTGPLVNPMPGRQGMRDPRADVHHNPEEAFGRGRVSVYQPRVPRREPRAMSDSAFDEVFAALSCDRDRAIAAFYVSTGARAAELLGVTCDRVDIGQQLVGVIRKGSGDLQWLPAMPDAFVWLQRYRQGLREQVPSGAGDAVWWTRRRPWRPLTYPAMRAVLVRVNQQLGTNWTLHDLRHTAARRMVKDPRLTLPDVQWLLGHAHLTTTQVYLEPRLEEVVERCRTHHRQRSEPVAPPAPAEGYRPEVMAALLGVAR